MTKNRMEAFSDGVIAIIVTVMIFDLKLQNIPDENTFWMELLKILPRFFSYIISFFIIAVMWVNHHQLLHQIKHADRKLLWYNIHLLFWMSLIPFITNLIGSNYLLPESSCIYGIIFFFNVLAFTLLRGYASGKGNLLQDTINSKNVKKVKLKNYVGMIFYLLGSVLSFISFYISFALFLIVAFMYFVPEKIIHEKEGNIL